MNFDIYTGSHLLSDEKSGAEHHGDRSKVFGRLKQCEALVFGAIAGASAGSYAGSVKLPFIDNHHKKRQTEKISRRFSKNGGRPSEETAEIKRIMTEYVGIIRDEAGLNKAIYQLRTLAQRRPAAKMGMRWHPSLLQAFRTINMTQLSLAMALAALERRESRGAHFRADFPERNNRDFKLNIIIFMDDISDLNFRLEDASKTRSNHWLNTK